MSVSGVSVLVPYRPDGGWRDRAWAWVSERIGRTLPGAEIVVCGETQPGDGPAVFNHPAAINEASRRATGDIFVIEDADTAFDPDWVRGAVELVAHEQVWAMTTNYEQLTRESTESLLASPPDAEIDPSLEKIWVGEGVSWAGLLVVPRRAFELVGGYDERFERWGGDDLAFTAALRTLWGPVTRTLGRATHLWHPRDGLDAQPRAQADLMHRYLDADGSTRQMAEVLL